MKWIKYLIFLFLCGCTFNSVSINKDNFYIYQVPEEKYIVEALNIIFSEFVEQEIYTKDQVLDIINNKSLNKYKGCKSSKHKLRVIFMKGTWSDEKRKFCVYSDHESLKGMCLSGLFNGAHTVRMIIGKDEKIHKTALAHEVFHYLQIHIDGASAEDHEPRKLWEDLVGYHVKEKIGTINEALKEADL
jgi:hypothetical protein